MKRHLSLIVTPEPGTYAFENRFYPVWKNRLIGGIFRKDIVGTLLGVSRLVWNWKESVWQI